MNNIFEKYKDDIDLIKQKNKLCLRYDKFILFLKYHGYKAKTNTFNFKVQCIKHGLFPKNLLYFIDIFFTILSIICTFIILVNYTNVPESVKFIYMFPAIIIGILVSKTFDEIFYG